MKFRSWLAQVLISIAVKVDPSKLNNPKPDLADFLPNGAKLADAASMNLSPDMIALQAFQGLLASGWEIDAAAGSAYKAAIVAFLLSREEYWSQVIETASLTPWLIPSFEYVDPSTVEHAE